MSTSESPGNDAFFRYLTWSDEDERWQIVCTDAGHGEIGPDVPYPPNKEDHPSSFKSVATGRTLNEYQIIYITRGSGEFRTGNEQYAVKPGSVLFLFPGIPHSYRPDSSTGWSEYWVGFKGSHADTMYREGFISASRPYLELGLRNSVLGLYTQILDQVRSQPPLYQLKTGALIMQLVAEMLSCERGSAQPSHSEILVAKAKFLMEERVDGETNLAAIGESLGMSTSHLNEVFKSYTSMTPYQYFISIKIGRAKELLERGSSVKEVAFRLGFSDEYYFSRLFKSKTGISPSHWKDYLRR